jgi:hypothetical protein
MDRMAPSIPVAIVLFAAVAVVALRAAAKPPEPRRVLVTEPAPVTVTAGESRPRLGMTTGTHDDVGHEAALSPGPPGPPGRPAGAVEQMQHVFHELHADGRNALCAICDSRCRSG